MLVYRIKPRPQRNSKKEAAHGTEKSRVPYFTLCLLQTENVFTSN